MPASLSHVVMFTDDLAGVVSFLTDVARIKAVNNYEVEAQIAHELFGWPLEHGGTRGAFVGEGPGSCDVLEIPEALRDTVKPGVRLLAIVSRDAVGSGEAAAAAGFAMRGPFNATAATGLPMTMTEVIAGGLPFELVQFG